MSSSSALTGRFGGLPVVVVGDVMLDAYIWGEVRRISPEAPVPVVEVQRQTARPGGAGNVGANIAALGGTPRLVGVAGDDAHAEVLAATLAAAGVAAGGVVRLPTRATTVKTRVLAHNQQMLRLDTETTAPLSDSEADTLLAAAQGALEGAALLVLSDYAKGSLTAPVCRALIDAARAAGLPVVVDPKGADFGKYAGATVITPNTRELAVVAGIPDQQMDVEREGRALLTQLGGAALLVTRGPEGMTLLQQQTPPLHLSAQARAVFDVTGAGDTVVAVLALALAAGASLPEAAALANTAAGIVVGKIGTATLSQQELSER